MKEYKLKLIGQNLTKVGTWEPLISGSKGYVKFKIDMDDDWKGCTGRVMKFATAKAESYSPIYRDGSCDLPDDVSDYKKIILTAIGVSGDTKIISKSLEVRQK